MVTDACPRHIAARELRHQGGAAVIGLVRSDDAAPTHWRHLFSLCIEWHALQDRRLRAFPDQVSSPDR